MYGGAGHAPGAVSASCTYHRAGRSGPASLVNA